MPGMRRRTLTSAVLTAAAVVTVLTAGPAGAAPPPPTGCAQVEFIAVRGTNEAGPVGVLQQLANAVSASTRLTVNVYGLPYPATTDWVNSVNAGKSLMSQRIAAQAAACPNKRFVVAGYSQGAWVVGDSLVGGGGGWPSPVDPVYAPKVAAVVMYGDPRFRSGEAFNAGTAGVNAPRNGIIPRDLGAFARYANRTRNYCELNDTICQYGSSGSGHFVYTQKYTSNAAAFIVGRLGS
jgi:hypothetical protein